MLLSLLAPQAYKGAVAQVAWPTVLLICGIVTYVDLMQEIGTVDLLGKQVASIGIPLLAALLHLLHRRPRSRRSPRPPASSAR